MFQYRKRYGLHAIEEIDLNAEIVLFQYRKRYGLHAIYDLYRRRSQKFCFNTASGMDCMQLSMNSTAVDVMARFNTASGMDCMQFVSAMVKKEFPNRFQYRKRYGLHAINLPPPISCVNSGFNTASGMDCMQYCLPEALETVSPEVGFLILTPFSRFSPKCAELFCREKCFERGLKPVIARALLSTKGI